MGNKLAIQGHPTRGKEIIELLEMMGGINKNMLSAHIGDVLNPHVYFLEPDSSDNRIVWNYLLGLEWDGRASEMIIFTLEEFLKKFPYKIGDKVYTKSDAEGTIIDMSWNGIEVLYQLSSERVNALGYFHANELKPYKEESMEDNKLFGTVSNPVETKSYTVGLKDGKVIDNSIDASQFMQLGKIFAVCFNTENYENEVELKLGDYEIVVRDGKTYAVKNKPKYPTTYEECCEIIHSDPNFYIDTHLYSGSLEALYKLLICRTAYWKIAGEHMGLDKPWEPDWDNLSTNHEFIKINGNDIPVG